MKNITIAGGGLVGSLLAYVLAKKGYNVNVYEQRPDMRKKSIDGGKSINLVISHRGWTALEKAGIADEIRERLVMPDRAGDVDFFRMGSGTRSAQSDRRRASCRLCEPIAGG